MSPTVDYAAGIDSESAKARDDMIDCVEVLVDDLSEYYDSVSAYIENMYLDATETVDDLLDDLDIDSVFLVSSSL